MHGPESDNMIAPQLSAELPSLETAGAGPASGECPSTGEAGGNLMLESVCLEQASAMLHTACCCMCAAEGEVTRAVHLILRQGQICNTENWHLRWDLEIEKDGNITLISKQLLLLCCFPSVGRRQPSWAAHCRHCAGWCAVFTSPHFSQNWQKSSQPSQLSPGSDSEYSHFSSGGYGIDISMDGILG